MASLIEARGLCVRYADASAPALRDVDLSIPKGAFVLIGGPSGGGKSTLAQALIGLIPQTTAAEVTGHISVAGLDPRRHRISQMATHVGIVFQNPATQLFNGTVEEEVSFGPRNLGLAPNEVAQRVAAALDATTCHHLWDCSVRHLSGGEQQQVATAAVLAMRPEILILDEPTANLDQRSSQSIVQTLARLHREHHTTIVVIEHRLSPFLPHADRLVWVVGGRIVASGPPVETLSRVQPPPPTRCRPSPSDEVPLVTLEDVTAGYDHRPVLKACSLTLHRGELAALVGPNGVGKTTLACVLAGTLRPRRGGVFWHTNGRQQRVGFLQQNPRHQLVCDTVEEEVHFGPRNLGLGLDGHVGRILAQTGLLALRHRPTHALSVGEQQRLALAATLATQPALLILDEPTLGQDQEHLYQVMDVLSDLNRTGQTVLLITHHLPLVKRYAGRVWRLRAGKAFLA